MYIEVGEAVRGIVGLEGREFRGFKVFYFEIILFFIVFEIWF